MTKSTDGDLSSTIERIKCGMCDITEIHTVDDAVTYMAHWLTVFVGKALLNQNALLLPDVHDSSILSRWKL